LRSEHRKGFLSFITNFAILGVMLGTAALIITLSILDGFEREIKSKVVEFTAHIQVQGYQNLPLENYTASMERVMKEVAGVQSISPFAAKEGMIRSRDGVDGIYLKGIDPLRDVVTPKYNLVEGRFITDANKTREIVVGKRLALRLNAHIGDKLAVFALPRGQNTQPKVMQFQLVGVYESGMAEFDDIYAYTNLRDAQSLFQLGDNVSGYDVLVKDITQVDDIAKQIQDLLEYPHFTRTVFQLYHNLFSWVELQKKMSPILLSLIIIVATINIIGTILMFVLEKTRAIGILKSLGASPKIIRKIFMYQGIGIATVGIVLGNILAFTFCVVQLNFKLITLPSEIYYMNAVPVLMRPENFVLVTAIAYVLCLLTVLLPSRAAARMNTVNALRFG
jgi:lipoprotein-releasing system permease protein